MTENTQDCIMVATSPTPVSGEPTIYVSTLNEPRSTPRGPKRRRTRYTSPADADAGKVYCGGAYSSGLKPQVENFKVVIFDGGVVRAVDYRHEEDEEDEVDEVDEEDDKINLESGAPMALAAHGGAARAQPENPFEDGFGRASASRAQDTAVS